MKALVKGRVLPALLCVCLLMFSGCRTDTQDPEPVQPEQTPLLTVLVEELPESLDPLAAEEEEAAALVGYLCDGLLEYNAQTGRPAPCLARSWDVSDDQLTLTLYLETGATFADGSSVNASAVVANIQRWQSQGSDQLKEQLSAIQTVRASGTSQVVLTLSRPDAGLFSVFCSPQTRLVSPSALSQGTASTDPMGAGPYRLEEKKGGKVLLTQRADYYKGEPAHQQVEFQSVAPITAQTWTKESLDYLVIGDLVEQITPGTGYQTLSTTGTTSYQLYLNLERLNLNTVRQLIGQTVQSQVTLPQGCSDQGGLLPDVVWEGEAVTFSTATTANLAQYGYSEMTLICPESARALSLARQIQQALVGQNCTVEILPLGEEAFSQALSQGDYELCLMEEQILDCTDWLGKFTSPQTDPCALSSDSLIKQAQGLMNMAYTKERSDALEVFCQELARQAAVIPLCQNRISMLSEQNYYLDPWGCFYA